MDEENRHSDGYRIPEPPVTAPMATGNELLLDQESDDAGPEKSLFEKTIIILALCLALFLAALDVTIVTTAIPAITAHFDSSAGYVWIGSAFLLANAACVTLWGRFSDIFGRKPTLLAPVAIFWIGSLLCAVSVSIGMLIGGRAVQGAGASGLIVLPNICIADLFSMRTRGIFYGVMGVVWAVASTLGPVLGGLFAEKVSWRWCFYINLPLSGFALVNLSIFLKVHNPKTPLKQGLAAIDWVGCFTIIGGVLMVFMGLELGGSTFPWKSATTICLLVFGAVTIGLFAYNERRFALYPIMPTSLFRHRTSVICFALSFLHAGVFMAGNFYLPLYFQGCIGATPLQSGVYILPFAIAIAVSEISVGWYNKHTGGYVLPIVVGMAGTVLGYGLFVDLGWEKNWYKIIIYQIVAGFALGFNFQQPLVALQSTLKPHEMGSATATVALFRQLGTSTTVTIGGVIFNNRMSKQYSFLESALGRDLALKLSGPNATRNVDLARSLTGHDGDVVKQAYWDAMRVMFIVYLALACLGLVITPFITKTKLTDEHREHRTGLASLKPEKR